MPVYTIRDLKNEAAGRRPPARGPALSRFVGRTQELALLHARLAQAVRGQGQVLGIMGEPGLGKSRLLAEFARGLEGQAVTYSESSKVWPIASPPLTYRCMTCCGSSGTCPPPRPLRPSRPPSGSGYMG